MPFPDAPTEAEWVAFAAAFAPTELSRLAAPVRVGMDRRTGKVLIGWPHVMQSMTAIFETRFGERILREWVGSFVPHLLGQNITYGTITRFWWAIISSIDLWEPNYSIREIDLVGSGGEATTPELIRVGHVLFAPIGAYYPRGHLGDRTIEPTRSSTLLGGPR